MEREDQLMQCIISIYTRDLCFGSSCKLESTEFSFFLSNLLHERKKIQNL